MKKYFSIPADFKKSTIDEYDKLNIKYKDNSQIIETYGNISVENDFESGRVVSQLPQIDMVDLAEYVSYSKKKGIEFNYTLNSPNMGNKEFSSDGITKIYEFLNTLYSAGVRSLTVTLPSIQEVVKASKLNFKVKASTLCQITNANKALFFKQQGIERIVVDESINRDFKALRSIREEFGEKVEVIVNPICHKNCIYRSFHYNQIGHDSLKSTNEISRNYFEHRCILQRYDKLSNLLKLSWIRPEDLKYYMNIGINYFKLQGRHTFIKGGDPIKTVKCYIEESYDGNLLDVLNMFAPLNSFQVDFQNKKLDGFIKPYVEKEGFCDNNCNKCRYCEKFIEKCLNTEEAIFVIEKAKKFYKEYDEFNQLIIDKNEVQKVDKVEDDFDFSFD